MLDQQPTWLAEECPSWCAGEHQEDDHVKDRCHISEVLYVVAVVAAEDSAHFTSTMTGHDLTVTRGRYVGEVTEWMAIEPVEWREPRLILTVESAARLMLALQLQLADIVPTDRRRNGLI